MSIVLTGFGPFPGVQKNPTQSLIELMPERILGFETVRVVVPTAYETAAILIEKLLVESRPKVCLCLGVSGRGAFRLETTARNFDYCQAPDQSGIARNGLIEDNGPEKLYSTLPLTKIYNTLKNMNISVVYSDDAGGYVCNHLFYIARRTIDRSGIEIPCGFLHVPEIWPLGREREQLIQMREVVFTVLEIILNDIASDTPVNRID